MATRWIKIDVTTPDKSATDAPVKIVSVDAQEGGRLFVTSQASPGATVRLYRIVRPPEKDLRDWLGRNLTPRQFWDLANLKKWRMTCD